MGVRTQTIGVAYGKDGKVSKDGVKKGNPARLCTKGWRGNWWLTKVTHALKALGTCAVRVLSNASGNVQNKK